MRFRATPASELAARVAAVLATLPSHQRAVFLFIRDKGVSYGAVAERMEPRPDEFEQAFVDALIALDEAVERRKQAHSIAVILRRIGSVLGLSRRRSGG